MGYDVTINEERVDEAAAAVGCSTRQQLEEYLGMPMRPPVTVSLIACVLVKLPITFDALFSVV